MAYDEHLLRSTIQAAATGVAAVGFVLVVVAWAAEFVRRRHATSRFVLAADRLVPSTVHRTAIAALSVLTGIGSLTGARPAAADESIRDWLSTPTTTSVPASHDDSPTTPAPVEPNLDGPPAEAPATTTPDTASSPSHSSATIADPPPPADPPAPTTPPRPTPAAAPAPAARVSATGIATATATDHYTVVPGDCLWNIAAARLPAGATNTDIDRGWRAIYAANRAAIGEDPGLIHPGLTLALPASTAAP